MNKRFIFVLLSVISILFVTFLAIAFARGYRLDFSKKDVTTTGILVATSDPDGAEVIVDGKFSAATNSNLSLKPGSYFIRIRKEGYSVWEKKIDIKQEEVIKTNAFLFPILPNLRPITYSGALNPTISNDNSKIVYGVASASAQRIDNNGVWILDMGQTFFQSNTRQISRGVDIANSKFAWSLDNKQIIATTSAGTTYLLNSDQFNEVPKIANILPDLYVPLDRKLSPDESKVLYTATASSTMSPRTIFLPGSNPTPETRNIEAGKTYVYDIKEDKNYLVEDCDWFPSSRHLLCINSGQISVMEFDGTNKAVVFNGQFDPKAVFSWPNWSKIVILTSLGSGQEQENLYTINLR